MGNTASEEVLRSREKLPNQTSLGMDASSCFLGAGVRGGLFGLEDEQSYVMRKLQFPSSGDEIKDIKI